MVHSGGFIERPVTEAKIKNSVRSYEWMPDKDHAQLHREDKRTSRVKVLASTNEDQLGAAAKRTRSGRIQSNNINNNNDNLIKFRKRVKPILPSTSSSTSALKHRLGAKVEKPTSLSRGQNEVFVDPEELLELRKKQKAAVEAKEFERKKELRKKGNWVLARIERCCVWCSEGDCSLCCLLQLAMILELIQRM